MTPASLVLSELRRTHPDKSDAELDEILAQWDLFPYEEDGQLTGVGMMKGAEFHFHSTPEFKFKRHLIRDSLQPLLERFGFLTTRVALDDLGNQRFNKLFGFKPTWADEQFQYFILTELPFGERKSCQSLQ